MQTPSFLPLRPLGKTGLEVTALCVGCAPLGNMPETFAYSVAEETALATIREIFRSPINFLDTAASYGDGESERRIGIVLKELGGVPQGYVIATKADRDLKTNEFTGDQMRRSVERSLTLLGLEQLPLCYLHDPEWIGFEAAMAPGGPVEALRRCQEEGLIQHLGIAGGPIDMMQRFVETDLFSVAISHNRYTLLNQEAGSFWDVCVRHQVAAVNAAPYGSGMLAKGPSNYPRYMYGEASPELIDRAIRLEEICKRYGLPLAAVALQFSLRDSRIASTIVGMSKPERLHETIALAQLSIPDELWSEVEALGPAQR
ncbi:D-threo-aldose 1-dehydrogenase [Thermosporothrix hazakensis]|uniref:D-threo-aldose 1-dehydrogenase n=2 Tax=Thermosporothrix TaxID=768650 RepID=A0A326UDR1_THEHA|nr:aldo/keto reductase [Thermosporothrix hazakensis]PZW36065.1 D-threo-aldose 1-dehydrogenase [Thermosporothrix hazakensis]BBH88531.1 oxidoreductase [Thermosporothrix sp. COM3]GCE46716.1 oxidoreductase [Thermosporothrix hazakensis]